jgi:hypothetical protein
MAKNIFEGWRRVAKVITVLWVIGWCTAAFYDGRSIYDNCAIAMPIIQKQVELVSEAKRQGEDVTKSIAGDKLMELEIKYPLALYICGQEARDGQWLPQLLKDLGQKVLGVISGLFFLWTFTWAIGWIVRGFKGIPRGQDKK